MAIAAQSGHRCVTQSDCAVRSPEEIKALDAEFSVLSPEDRAKHMEGVMGDLKDVIEAIENPKTPGEQKRAEEAFKAMSEEEQKTAIQFWQRFMMAFLASFYQSLSVMVHGEKLTSLVAQAKAGNDKAFAKAVQIDKRILFSIPYFKRRFADANAEEDRKFTEDVGAHLQRPPWQTPAVLFHV